MSDKIFSEEEALKASIEYFNGDELAAKVFIDKYALRDNDQRLKEKTPDDMHRRLSKEFSRIERKKFKNPLSEEQIYDLFKKFERIVPQGSPMYGVGNTYQIVSLSNCYVAESPLDSYGGILRTDHQIAQVSKRRGGVGTDISHLRPSGAPTHNAARSSTGILPFLERFSNTIREVGQSGRRGALLCSISIHHPEVVEFAKIKRDLKKVTGANISIRFSDEFLKAVEKDEEYEQRWPVDKESADILHQPFPVVSKKVSAKKVWREIVENAHAMAEPGILFWDNVTRFSPADSYSEDGFKTVSTNPCGELPLSVGDSCRLMCLNLYGYVKNKFEKNSYFDYGAFFDDTVICQRLMDDLVDLELEAISRIIDKVKKDPEPEHVKEPELSWWRQVKDACSRGRRTGTGITALGDMLAALGVKYGSKQSIETVGNVYKAMKFGSYYSSIEMAKELGAFPVWDWNKEKSNEFIQRFKDDEVNLGDDRVIKGNNILSDMKKHGRRNIACNTTAPAGSVSILTQTTSGIEPLFMLGFTRRKKVNPDDKNIRVDFVDQMGDSWQEYKVYHSKVSEWLKATGLASNKTAGCAPCNDSVLKDSPWTGACADDLDWVNRVKMQAAAQYHVDHSISSTVNLPENASVERVQEIYEAAWKAGCKGITIYRKNCRTGVLIEKKEEANKEFSSHNAPKRPKSLPCDVYYFKAKNKHYTVFIGLMNGKPYEVFAYEGEEKPKQDKGFIQKLERGNYRMIDDVGNVLVSNIKSVTTTEEAAISRLASTALRHGADVAYIVQQCEKVEGGLLGFTSCMARALKKYIKDGTKVTGDKCGNCESVNLMRNQGCVTCADCGWSKC